MSHRVARGWAWHPKHPTRRVRLELFYRDIFLGSVSAGLYRADLKDHGVGDGHHAFTFHLPDDVADADFEATDLVVASAGPERWTLPLSPELAPSAPRARRLPDDHRQALGPFLERVRDRAAPERPETRIGRRRRIDTLCEGAAGHDVSAFVAHIAAKYGRAELAANDTQALWRWYLGTYASERGPRLAPLSRDDIAYLTRSTSGGVPHAADLLAAPDPPDRAYEWALDADRLFLADCLVRPEEIEALRAVGATRSTYPLSAFMGLAMAETAILRSRPTVTERQRKRLYALFMLIGLRNPAVLSYLPTEWMLRFLEGPTGLEGTLRDLFGTGLTRDRYAAWVEASGYDLASQTFRGHRYDGHRVCGGPAIVTATAPVDVQVFGPFRRKMGLGESCRRVAAALQTTSLSVNFVDYDIGTTGGFVEPDVPLGRTRAARLNLLHLNAEEIPEALAYLPDVFSQAATVAMPYWELNRPAQSQRLGLSAIDEIWVASRFLVDVFADSGKSVRWIGMCCSSAPHPTAEQRAALRLRLGLPPDTFVFLTTSDALSSAARKNPLAVIEAFRAAFATQDVVLLVKTHNLAGPLSDAQAELWERVRALCAVDPRLVLVDRSFDATTQRTLLAACDCLVSLHRAEGLGLDVLDALDLGTPVIATDYSGTRDLATPATAWLVDFDMRAVAVSDYSFVEPGHVWAEPRLATAIQVMRQVVADRNERERRVLRGKALAATTATADRFGERIGQAVDAALRTGS